MEAEKGSFGDVIEVLIQVKARDLVVFINS